MHRKLESKYLEHHHIFGSVSLLTYSPFLIFLLFAVIQEAEQGSEKNEIVFTTEQLKSMFTFRWIFNEEISDMSLSQYLLIASLSATNKHKDNAAMTRSYKSNILIVTKTQKQKKEQIQL